MKPMDSYLWEQERIPDEIKAPISLMKSHCVEKMNASVLGRNGCIHPL